MVSYHKFNEHKSIERITEELTAGKQVALVSDAGTPGISDPGYLIVRACIEKGIIVTCLPGATAFVPALVASGLPSDRFIFEGFLPHKKGRLSRIEALKEREVTTIFYESPNRLLLLLEQLFGTLADEREVVVVREISKMYEEYARGKPSTLLKHFQAHPPLGEIVVLVAPIAKQKRVHKNKFKDDTCYDE